MSVARPPTLTGARQKEWSELASTLEHWVQWALWMEENCPWQFSTKSDPWHEVQGRGRRRIYHPHAF